MPTLLEWIEKCNASHSKCKLGNVLPLPLPKRIIDVGLSDGRVRLVENIGRAAPYVALSHCVSVFMATCLIIVQGRGYEAPGEV